MKKYYCLKYLFIGGERDLRYDNLDDFSTAFDAAQEDRYVTQSSIIFWCEDDAGNKLETFLIYYCIYNIYDIYLYPWALRNRR